MSRHRSWMLSVASLLVVGTLGLGDKPESVADEVMQSPPRPEFGRDEAIAAIEKLGGRCKFDEDNPDRPIIRVYLTGDRISDADLKRLKGLTSIQTLSLAGTQITDAGMEHLKGLTSLRNASARRHPGHRPRFGASERTDRSPRTEPRRHAGHRHWPGASAGDGQPSTPQDRRHSSHRPWPGASEGPD